MVQDLKEKVQEQDAARDAAKKIQQLKKPPDRGKVWGNALNQAGAGEKVTDQNRYKQNKLMYVETGLRPVSTAFEISILNIF